MKKLIFLLTINFIFTLQNVSILNFSGTGVSENEAKAVSDLFAVSIVNTKKYNVLDRANMNKVLAEQSFQASGCTDSSCAVEIGKLLNMDYIFTGAVLKINNKIYITVNQVSIETGQIKKSQKTKGFVYDNLEKEIDNLVSVISGSKVIYDIQPKKKRNKAKVFTGITSLVSIVSAGGIFTYGYLNFLDNEQLYQETTADFDNLWDNYKNSEILRDKLYKVSIATGATGIVLGIISIVLPKEKRVVFIPVFNKNKIKLAINIRR